MDAKTLYSYKFIQAIEETKSVMTNPIYVIYGDISLLNLGHYKEFAIDLDNITSTSGSDVFSREWFSNVFTLLMTAQRPSILSYAQYSYLITYITPDFFKERVIILEDNLRRVFPLNKSDFVIDTQEDDGNSAEIPLYQVDQFQSGDDFFYIAKLPVSSLGVIKLCLRTCAL